MENPIIFMYLCFFEKQLQQFQKKKEKKGGSTSSSSNAKSSRKTSGSEQESVDTDVVSIRPLALVNPDGGSSPRAIDGELAPTDLSASPSPDEGGAELPGSVDSLVDDVAPVDSSALVLPLATLKPDEGGSPLAIGAELVPTDFSVPPSPDDGGAEVPQGVDSLVAGAAPLDLSVSVFPWASAKPDEVRSPMAIDAEKASQDLSVSPSPDEGRAEVLPGVDSLVADVASSARSVSVMAPEEDSELGSADSLVPPSMAKPGDGEGELASVVDSSLDVEVGAMMGDAEVVPIGPLVMPMMVDGDGNLIPVDSSAPPASEETGKGGAHLAEIDRGNQEILCEIPWIQLIDGDPKLVPADSSYPSASEEAGEGGAAPSEIDGENQGLLPKMQQTQPIDGDLMSETSSGKVRDAFFA